MALSMPSSTALQVHGSVLSVLVNQQLGAQHGTVHRLAARSVAARGSTTCSSVARSQSALSLAAFSLAALLA